MSINIAAKEGIRKNIPKDKPSNSAKSNLDTMLLILIILLTFNVIVF